MIRHQDAKKEIITMLAPSVRVSRVVSVVVVASTVVPDAFGQTLWQENSQGDLSNNRLAPTAFTLAEGTSSIIGSVDGRNGDVQDWIALTIPAGHQLTSLTLASFTSLDGQGFTGVQAGSSFVGSDQNTASYLGYTHFGPSAGNVGANILPQMGTAFGAQGFSGPLGAGTYTFLIQQLGSTTQYKFDYEVTAIPAPGALAVLGVGAIAARRRRR